jgi:curved DNA-binding protein CbpA
MVADPYLALNLPHTASDQEIKRSYRDLARRLHPDRLVEAPESERDAATERFAKVAEAYAILSDIQRKAEYDHIYKFGGYDEDDAEEKTKINNNQAGRKTPDNQSSANFKRRSSEGSRKRKSTGIGYTCSNPLSFLSKSPEINNPQSQVAMKVPSRFQTSAGGFQFAFSASWYSHSPKSGVQTYTSSTTQLLNGKKSTRTETATVYPDGRKEVVIEQDDSVERRVEHVSAGERYAQATSSSFTTTTTNQQDPWYIGAWHELRNRLSMCYAPCTAVAN